MKIYKVNLRGELIIFAKDELEMTQRLVEIFQCNIDKYTNWEEEDEL